MVNARAFHTACPVPCPASAIVMNTHTLLPIGGTRTPFAAHAVNGAPAAPFGLDGGFDFCRRFRFQLGCTASDRFYPLHVAVPEVRCTVS